MVKIPIDPDCEWNYLFFEWMRLGVDYLEEWYSVGNIDYDVLENLLDDLPHFYVDTNI